MSLVVVHAVWGALKNEVTHSFEVSSILQTLINASSGVVPCSTTHFGDPLQGIGKHFGALVNRNGTNFYFACNENQTIDFNHGGGIVTPGSAIRVLFATWGALPSGNVSGAQAFDVSGVLQSVLDAGSRNTARPYPDVLVNSTLFGDPCPGSQKHFAATVSLQGKQISYACLEGQTIAFDVYGSS